MMHNRSFNSALSKSAVLAASVVIWVAGFPYPPATGRSKPSAGAIADSDPCSKPEQFIKDRIADMKALQQKIASLDSSNTPSSVADLLGLSSNRSQELQEVK